MEGYLNRCVLIILSIILLQASAAKSASAQSNNVPAFPDDNAELVDPDLANLTETAPPAAETTRTIAPATAATTAIPDAGTGTPTAPAVAIALLGAFSVTALVWLWRKRRPA